MEVKEGEVLSREGKTIQVPHHAGRADAGTAEGVGHRTAERVVYRYRKLGGVPKLVILPAVVIGLFFVFAFLAVVGVALALRALKRGLVGR